MEKEKKKEVGRMMREGGAGEFCKKKEKFERKEKVTKFSL